MSETKHGVAPPGMSNLTAEQSVANELIFGQRYLSIQQQPILGRAERRRMFRAATGRKRA